MPGKGFTTTTFTPYMLVCWISSLHARGRAQRLPLTRQYALAPPRPQICLAVLFIATIGVSKAAVIDASVLSESITHLCRSVDLWGFQRSSGGRSPTPFPRSHLRRRGRRHACGCSEQRRSRAFRCERGHCLPVALRLQPVPGALQPAARLPLQLQPVPGLPRPLLSQPLLALPLLSLSLLP